MIGCCKQTLGARNAIKKMGFRSFYLPAGNTPVPLYKHWESCQPEFLGKSQLIQLDEVINGEQKGVFAKFFADHLPTWSQKIEKPILEYRQAEVAILGLGKNGHLGFHEPDLQLATYLACVPLAKYDSGEPWS